MLIWYMEQSLGFQWIILVTLIVLISLLVSTLNSSLRKTRRRRRMRVLPLTTHNAGNVASFEVYDWSQHGL